MKKLLILAVFIASLQIAKGQVSFSVPLGFSSNKVPTMGANLQANIHGFIIGAGLDGQMSRKVVNGNFYWSKIGKAFNLSDLNSLEISVGMGDYRCSSDVKSLNQGLGLINVQYVHRLALREDGSFFASVTTTKEFTMITGGFRFIFGRGNNRDGCPSTWQ